MKTQAGRSEHRDDAAQSRKETAAANAPGGDAPQPVPGHDKQGIAAASLTGL
jgi:hypothetical protein